MNIREFKEIAMNLENYKEKFKLFRTWAENYYKLYCENRQCVYMENLQEYGGAENFSETEDEKSFLYEWGMVIIDDGVELFSELGIEFKEGLLEIHLTEDMEGGVYCWLDFKDLYQIIQGIEDDIDFFYGLLILLSKIQKSQRIYKEYVVKVKKGIIKCGLKICEEKIIDNKKKVFIAIWFDDPMQKARETIMKAIKFCGYEPIIIDIKEHNNQIVPEIFKEIENSKFVVADLTGQRGGVYYEAGYAIAKEKKVILSCKEGESTHFDVAQINTIYWKDETDLFERLTKRIEATIGLNE